MQMFQRIVLAWVLLTCNLDVRSLSDLLYVFVGCLQEKTAEPWILHEFEDDFYGEELRLLVRQWCKHPPPVLCCFCE